MRIHQSFIATVFLCLTTTLLMAQKGYSDKEYRKYPYWIKMMEDTTSNYFEVQKSFDLYWLDKEKPKEEDEIIGMAGAEEKDYDNKAGWLKKLFYKRKSITETEMAFSIKKYRHWQLMTEPWVQDDGSILYPSQRKKILDSIHH